VGIVLVSPTDMHVAEAFMVASTVPDQAVIHLFRARKRTIAIADDVEVSEVKIGCEPRIGHTPIMKDQ